MQSDKFASLHRKVQVQDNQNTSTKCNLDARDKLQTKMNSKSIKVAREAPSGLVGPKRRLSVSAKVPPHSRVLKQHHLMEELMDSQ